ncbi:helix-turn-helix domain-containing protein [Mesorhizobium sp. CAU 1741]|uniref:TetR/AcrR family transcriptional regulator n=1 Tax=Mesorhizobium sp. CAU 1741 TaxID=3140366 RepID=UPI00325AFB84
MESVAGTLTAAAGSADAKRTRILDGALKVFLAYGFGRTTMDDIARAAELSRPALYLVFRNKTDIYRELGRGLLAEVLRRAEMALAGPGTLLERLDHMTCFAFFDLFQHIEESPHGSELFDIKTSLAGDLMADWRLRMVELLERAIADEASTANVDLAACELTPKALAEVFLDSLEGMKSRLSGPRCHLEASQTSARVLAAALRR